MFAEKCIVGPEKNFTASDLLTFVESMIRSSKVQERRNQYGSNYSWLTSRDIGCNSVERDLEEFKPIVRKLTSENCAAIAVKLEFIDEGKTTTEILSAFKNILERQYSMQLMEQNVRRAKGRRDGRKKKQNKVHPVLMPPGRQPTVSFILN